MVSDTLDSALDNEDIEEEIEDEVEKVLLEIAGETIAQLPATAVPKKEKLKQPVVEEPEEVC